eukprot:10328475-Alexandrium_andersonii.AAC.1
MGLVRVWASRKTSPVKQLSKWRVQTWAEHTCAADIAGKRNNKRTSGQQRSLALTCIQGSRKKGRGGEQASKR